MFLGSSMCIFMHIGHTHTCPIAEQKIKYLQILPAAIYVLQDIQFRIIQLPLLLILTFILVVTKSSENTFDTPFLQALQSPAMKAVSSSKLRSCHPRVYCKLIPDSFSTYNLLLISIVAYKALAPSDTSFLPNSSPYNILQ